MLLTLATNKMIPNYYTMRYVLTYCTYLEVNYLPYPRYLTLGTLGRYSGVTHTPSTTASQSQLQTPEALLPATTH